MKEKVNKYFKHVINSYNYISHTTKMLEIDHQYFYSIVMCIKAPIYSFHYQVMSSKIFGILINTKAKLYLVQRQLVYTR